MIKIFLKYLMYGIMWGCLWFSAFCLVMDIANLDALQYIFENLTANILGSVLVGIGFTTSTIVYKIDRLHFGLQAAIHFAIGLGIYFPVAFSLGWLPVESPAWIAFSFVSGVLIFSAIWCGFYLHGRSEAKKINDRIKKQNSDIS